MKIHSLLIEAEEISNSMLKEQQQFFKDHINSIAKFKEQYVKLMRDMVIELNELYR